MATREELEVLVKSYSEAVLGGKEDAQEKEAALFAVVRAAAGEGDMAKIQACLDLLCTELKKRYEPGRAFTTPTGMLNFVLQ